MLGVDVFPTEMVTFWGTNSFVFRDVCWMCFSPVKKPWCFPVLTNLPNATPKLDRKNGTEENPTISPIPISPVHPTFKKGGGGTGAQSGGSTFVLSLLSLEKFFGWQEKNHHPGMWGGTTWKKMNDCLTQDIQMKLCNVAKLTVRHMNLGECNVDNAHTRSFVFFFHKQLERNHRK